MLIAAGGECLETVDRAPAIGAVLAREAQRQDLPFAALGGALHHPGHAFEHFRMDLLRHESFAHLMMLVVRLALLLEGLAELRRLLFGDAPQLIRRDQAPQRYSPSF
jgi:hypothetical protein